MRPRPFERFGAVALRMLDDERLAELAAGGDERAFAVVYERYGPALERYCLSLLGDPDDAADAAQSALTSAIAGLGGRHPDAPLRAWLFRIAHNEAMSVHRRRSPSATLEVADEPAGASIEGQLEGRERLATLVADVRDLPERQRAALVMRELSGLSHTEIAAALSMTPAAARQAIFEARVALHDFAEGRAMACDTVRRVISDRDRRVMRGRRIRAHLRTCAECRAFREAGRRRERDLALLFPPLPVGAGALARLLETGATTAGQAGGGAGAALAPAVPKLVVAGVLAVTAVGAAETVPRMFGTAPARGDAQAPALVHVARPPTPTARTTAVMLRPAHPLARRSPTAPASAPPTGHPAAQATPVHETPTRPERAGAGPAFDAPAQGDPSTPARQRPADPGGASGVAPGDPPAQTPASGANGTSANGTPPPHPVKPPHPAHPVQPVRPSHPAHPVRPPQPANGEGNASAGAPPGQSQGSPDPGTPSGGNGNGNAGQPGNGNGPANGNAGAKGQGNGNGNAAPAGGAGANGHGHGDPVANPSESPPA